MTIQDDKFGKFDLTRPLTEYEFNNFDKFMQISDDKIDKDIDIEKISLRASIESAMIRMQERFKNINKL
jgi:hypothetical protein